uniref:Glutathione peroxidase n=1 Tax=Amphiprion ocellaris TaxID=80972 RepID=A0AAQ5ZSV2_AMPOC
AATIFTSAIHVTSMANKSIYDFSAETLDGQPVPLSNYRGKVLLIVNEVILQLNALMEMYGDLNFTVLGFSCNQFGLQSPEVNHETLNILKYVRPGGGFVPKFPVFGKVEVNGLNEDPLFTYLKETLPFVNPVIGDMKKLFWSPIKVNDIRWNFEKFLITADGMPLKRNTPRSFSAFTLRTSSLQPLEEFSSHCHIHFSPM